MRVSEIRSLRLVSPMDERDRWSVRPRGRAVRSWIGSDDRAAPLDQVSGTELVTPARVPSHAGGDVRASVRACHAALGDVGPPPRQQPNTSEEGGPEVARTKVDPKTNRRRTAPAPTR